MFLSRLKWRMKAALFSYKAKGFANKTPCGCAMSRRDLTSQHSGLIPPRQGALL